MASAMPDLWLPSQSQDITAPRLVPNYTAWWQRHVCEQLTQGKLTWQHSGTAGSSTCDLLSHKPVP